MSRYGFTTPFDHTAYIAGIDKNFQLSVPRVHVKVDTNFENNRLQINVQPLSTDGDKNIVHYSVWPYTTPHQLFSFRPVENKNKLPKNSQQLNVSMNVAL